MLENIVEDLEYETKLLVEEAELGIVELEELDKAIDQLRKVREKADELVGKLRRLKSKIEGKELEEIATIERELLTPEEAKERFREEKLIEGLFGKKEFGKYSERKIVPFRESVIIALAQHPRASEKIKQQAIEIIEKYGLSEEEVQRIISWYYE